jgi:tripartite-type tricarboxylate transporter receptor subunit TctC
LRIVVPFTAAGTTDLLARVLSEPLGARLGQPVVVENRPGAGGNIGADAVAKATDGYTFLMTTIGTAAINYGLYRKSMPYKPEELAAVSDMAAVPNVIVAAPALDVRTLADAVALAQQSDQKAALGAMAAFGTTDFRDDLTKITVPTLVIHGADDAVVPFEGSGKRTAEAIPGSEVVVIDDAPHGVNVSDAKEWNAAVVAFLAK